MGINRYLLLISIGLYACQHKDLYPESQDYNLLVPGNFPVVTVMKDNPQTREGVALGRILFYDKRLSGNNQLSCASCHHQSMAFTDGFALSTKGASGKRLPRTAPSLINLAWANNGLFWDGGSANLESQAFGPLTNADEMNQNLEELVAELNEVPGYITRFRATFNDEIKAAYIVRALAQFQRTMISGNSRYDKYIRKETGGIFSEKELQGLVLFNSHCRSCHTGELLTDNDYHNNGLDDDFSNNALEGLYQGRYRISYNPEDLGKFKTPTLRNIGLTAPYMHDGRLTDLTAVLEHYSNGVKVSATTDTKNMQLRTDEQAAIIAFLYTLTDSTFIHNKDLNEPVIPQ